MAKDLIQYTKKLMDDLDQKEMYITHVYIAYKVILYYENNFGEVTQEATSKLLEIIDDIYDVYTNMDESELIDSLVSEKLNNI